MNQSPQDAAELARARPRLDVLLIAAYLLSGPFLLLLDHFGVSVPGRGPVSPRSAVIYGLVSPLIGALFLRRHPRARFALYVFCTMEVVRCLMGDLPLSAILPAGVILYMQSPKMRALYPRLSAARIWSRMRSRALPRRAPVEPPEPRYVPSLVSWNLTAACDLRCPHCYLEAGTRAEGELDTAQAKALIDTLARMGTQMLIMTGGEPLLREDLPELVRHASRAGIHVVLGTNGTRLDRKTARALREAGLEGAGISVDSTRAAAHDSFRGREGALERTLGAIDACREEGLPVVVQSSVMEWNREELPELVRLAEERGAVAFNAYFLVCTGRGQKLTDVDAEHYEQTLRWLVSEETARQGGMLVRAKCAPHAARIAIECGSPLGGSAGCLAAKSYVRIGPRGEVTPCPYMPTEVGNVLDEGFERLWTTAPLFLRLRDSALGGRCGRCEHRDICGGCRARALAATGDALGEDPWCKHEPSGRDGVVVPPVTWTPEARARLHRVPSFIRARLEAGLEAHARARGQSVVTPGLMAEVRRNAPIPPRA